MNIRPAQDVDAENIATLRRESILAVNVKDYPPDVLEAWANRVSSERIRQTMTTCKRWVAVTRDRIEKLLGFGDHLLDDNEVSRLYVHKDHQGEGIGSRLLGMLEDSLKEQGHRDAYLLSSLTAVEFYRRHGYDISEETQDAHDPRITVIKMIKKLIT